MHWVKLEKLVSSVFCTPDPPRLVCTPSSSSRGRKCVCSVVRCSRESGAANANTLKQTSKLRIFDIPFLLTFCPFPHPFSMSSQNRSHPVPSLQSPLLCHSSVTFMRCCDTHGWTVILSALCGTTWFVHSVCCCRVTMLLMKTWCL